jgi:hypothetical protein
VHLGYGMVRYVNLVIRIEVAVEVCFVSLYSVLKKMLKCSTGKVCNCLIQFLPIFQFFQMRNVFFLLNTSFERAIDTPI